MEKSGYNFLLEMQGSRLERTNKRLFVIVIILISALIITNGLWLYHESQFDKTIKIEQEAESESGNVILNGTGEITYGERETDNNDQ